MNRRLPQRYRWDPRFSRLRRSTQSTGPPPTDRAPRREQGPRRGTWNRLLTYAESLNDPAGPPSVPGGRNGVRCHHPLTRHPATAFAAKASQAGAGAGDPLVAEALARCALARRRMRSLRRRLGWPQSSSRPVGASVSARRSGAWHLSSCAGAQLGHIRCRSGRATKEDSRLLDRMARRRSRTCRLSGRPWDRHRHPRADGRRNDHDCHRRPLRLARRFRRVRLDVRHDRPVAGSPRGTSRPKRHALASDRPRRVSRDRPDAAQRLHRQDRRRRYAGRPDPRRALASHGDTSGSVRRWSRC